jgi:hypothetical protein
MTIVKTKKGNHLHLEPALWLKTAVDKPHILVKHNSGFPINKHDISNI